MLRRLKAGALEMLSQVVQAVVALAESQFESYGDRFDDPLANEVSWLPMQSGGAIFRTHRLIVVSPQSLQFRPTLRFRFIYGVFFMFGIGVILIACGSIFGSTQIPWFMVLFCLAFGGTFCFLGAIISRSSVYRFTFDTDIGWCWRGGRRKRLESVREGKYSVPLDHVHAIQVLTKLCGMRPLYYNYEINLVLRDASRAHVVSHRKQRLARTDASVLADFLNIPVWDDTA